MCFVVLCLLNFTRWNMSQLRTHSKFLIDKLVFTPRHLKCIESARGSRSEDRRVAGLYVSSKFFPYICSKPLATSRALYLVMFPFMSCFGRKLT